MPITDVLQMIGRAGRPQYDTQAVACVMVRDLNFAIDVHFVSFSFTGEN